MRPLIAASAALGASMALAGVCSQAEAAHLVVGIGLPGIAVVAPAPVMMVPAPVFYGPRVDTPYGIGPAFGWRAHDWGGYTHPYFPHRGWR